MTRRDSGTYAAKHPREAKPDEKITHELRGKIQNGRIGCAAAFDSAQRLGVSPHAVGVTIDLMDIRIEKCQLGLFGFERGKKKVTPAAEVSPTLRQAVMDSLEDGRLTCRAAWDLAARFKISKMDMAAACERLAVRISKCQLGSF